MDKDLPTKQNDSVLDNLTDIFGSLSDAEIDILFDNEIVKEIPVISNAISICKAVNGIRERAYLKRLQQFINAMNQGIATSDKVEYYKERLTNKKQRNKELEYILLLIDRYLHIDKTIFLAKLYLAYLDKSITWNELTIMAEIIDRLLPGDYNTLVASDTFKTERDINTDSIQRLIAFGLFVEDFRATLIKNEEGTVTIDPPELLEKRERNYTRTELGNKMTLIIG